MLNSQHAENVTKRQHQEPAHQHCLHLQPNKSMIKLLYDKKNQNTKRKVASNCGKAAVSSISQVHILITKVDKMW